MSENMEVENHSEEIDQHTDKRCRVKVKLFDVLIQSDDVVFMKSVN